MFAYGLLTVGAIVAIYALLQERRLRTAQLSGANFLFAPLETTEKLLYAVTAAGFTVLLLSVITGVTFVSVNTGPDSIFWDIHGAEAGIVSDTMEWGCRRLDSMVSTLISGMSTALYTTLVGSVLNVWLMINYHVLAGGTVRLITALLEFGEEHARA